MQYRMLEADHPLYPKRLKPLKGAPKKLYVAGKMPAEDRLTVAIVGARECSQYGRSMAKELGKALALCKVQVISGMARGIDGAAQMGALEAGGESFAVLGCGVDVCYPREHRKLYEKLLERGGILTEQPPGMQPLPQFFPARNRIISGLSDVVVVIEAKEKSGSLITADQALEQGKDVYALPGPVNSNLSRGCNQLLKQGAGVIVSVEDFLEELQISCLEKIEKNIENKNSLESEEKLVYTCLDLYPKSPAEIAEGTGLPIARIMSVLFELEWKGYIQEIAKNYYVRCK